jgi:hypothetical protein
MYCEFCPETFHQGSDFVTQRGAVHGDEMTPEVLGVLPDDLTAPQSFNIGCVVSLVGPGFLPRGQHGRFFQ